MKRSVPQSLKPCCPTQLKKALQSSLNLKAIRARFKHTVRLKLTESLRILFEGFWERETSTSPALNKTK